MEIYGIAITPPVSVAPTETPIYGYLKVPKVPSIKSELVETLFIVRVHVIFKQRFSWIQLGLSKLAVLTLNRNQANKPIVKASAADI